MPEERGNIVDDRREHRRTLSIAGREFVRYEPYSRGGCVLKGGTAEGRLSVIRKGEQIMMERRFHLPQGLNERFVNSVSIDGDTMKWTVSLSNNPKNLPNLPITKDDPDIVVMTWRRER